MGVSVPLNVGVFVVDEVVEVEHLCLGVADIVLVGGVIVIDARLGILVPSGEEELAGDADLVFVSFCHWFGCWLLVES